MSELSAIEVNSLSKRYTLYTSSVSHILESITGKSRHRVCRALHEISFQIGKGKTVGIIGRNGSGKSTLLRILAGIIDPSSGGYKIRGLVAPVLELGAGFIPELKGIDNIILNGRLLGMSKSEVFDKAQKILDFAQIGDFAYQPVRTYSAGMQLRLGFAIAQSFDPDVLLIDEVLAVGDAAFQRKCIERIEQIKSQGATVLIVTHSLQDVAALCDYVIQLDAGKILREGTTEEVIRGYLEDIKDSSPEIRISPVESPNPHRKNTKEISIESIDLIDADDKPIKSINTGQTMQLRIRYCSNKAVARPMFRAQIYRYDRLFVHGTNTYRHGFEKESIGSDGVISLIYRELNLLSGRYYINVGVYPDEYGKAIAEHAYDFIEHAVSFEVESSRADGAGVVSMPHKWEWPS